MKPLRLEIKGLNSFMDKQIIDFTELTKYGLFGIFGSTGSGKTTVLDGITLSLYGKIARKSKNFINLNMDSAFVLYEFQISGNQVKRYRIERSFRQDKKTGTYKTGKCIMTDITGVPVVLADKVKEINNLCQDIIGLNAEDFQRTVVLPQGKFSEFLKLEGNERSKMLERLFRLEKYGEELTRKLKKKKEIDELSMASLEGEINAYGNVTQEQVNKKKWEKENIEEQEKQALKIKESCHEKYNQMKEIWQIQQELIKYEKKQSELFEMKEEMARLQEKIMQSNKALLVIPYIERYQETQNQRKMVTKDHKNAEEIQKKMLIQKEKIDACYQHNQKLKMDRIPILQEKIRNLKEGIRLQNEYDKLLKIRLSKTMEQKKLINKKEEYLSEEEKLGQLMLEIKEKGNLLEKNMNECFVNNAYRKQIINGKLLAQKLVSFDTQFRIDHDEIILLKNQIDKNSVEMNQLEKEVFRKEKYSDLDTYQKILLQNQNRKLKFQEAQEEISILQKRIPSLRIELQKKEKEKVEYQNKIDEIHEKVIQLELSQFASKLRHDLQEGDVCPVCGCIYHVSNTMKETKGGDYAALREKFEHMKINLQEKERNIMKINMQLNDDIEQREKITIKSNKLVNDFLLKPDTDYENILKKLDQYREKTRYVNTWKIELEKRETMEYDLVQRKQEVENDLSEIIKQMKIENFEDELKRVEKNDEKYQTAINTYNKIKEKQQSFLDKIAMMKEERNKLENNLAANEESILQKNIQLKENRLQREEYKFSDMSVENLECLLKDTVSKISEINSNFINAEKQYHNGTKEFEEIQKKTIELTSKINVLTQKSIEESEELRKKMEEQGFQDQVICENAIMKKSVQEDSIIQVENYQKQLVIVENRIKDLKSKLPKVCIELEEWENVKLEYEQAVTTLEKTKEQFIKSKNEYEELRKKWDILKNLMEQKEKIMHKIDLFDELLKLFRGKSFVKYVAMSRLKYISKAARHRLFEISNGNYGLEIDNEGKFIICDYKNGGIKRDTSTLSGGETFLVSLSLSLALSEQIQLKGSVPLELFFLDEGFGTLDEELLDEVMDSLEKLKNNRLAVGIISHVESVKARIPMKLIVTPSKPGCGGSKIRMEKN